MDHYCKVVNCDIVICFLKKAVKSKMDHFYYFVYLQVSSNHVLLHQKVLDLFIRLFESSFDELDVLIQVSKSRHGITINNESKSP